MSSAAPAACATRPVPSPGRRAIARLLAPLAAALLLVAACGDRDVASREAPVRILAAASLTNVLESLAPRLEAAAGRPVRMSFAASSTLARQVIAGAACDVFLSADVDWVDELEAAGRVAERRPLPANRLVLIVPAGTAGTPGAAEAAAATTDEDGTVRRLLAPGLARVAVADPSAVPAGRHARRSLTRAGAWTAVEPRLVVAANVRQALAWVETGDADAGIVYATDAAISDRVRVLGRLPVDPAHPVRGAAALTPEGAARPAARTVWAVLADAATRQTFAELGFDVTAPVTGSAAPGPPPPPVVP